MPDFYTVSHVRRRRSKATPKPIRGPECLAPIVRRTIGDDMTIREHFVAVYLDSRHVPIAVETISVGTLNASIVHPRTIFRAACLHNAADFVIAHNHPSGDPTPSEEDIAITRRLHEAASIMGIALVDHVILGSNGAWASFRELRLLKG